MNEGAIDASNSRSKVTVVLTSFLSVSASAIFWSQLSLVVISFTFPPANSTLWSEASSSIFDWEHQIICKDSNHWNNTPKDAISKR